jgi:hypothetical protein
VLRLKEIIVSLFGIGRWESIRYNTTVVSTLAEAELIGSKRRQAPAFVQASKMPQKPASNTWIQN